MKKIFDLILLLIMEGGGGILEVQKILLSWGRSRVKNVHGRAKCFIHIITDVKLYIIKFQLFTKLLYFVQVIWKLHVKLYMVENNKLVELLILFRSVEYCQIFIRFLDANCLQSTCISQLFKRLVFFILSAKYVFMTLKEVREDVLYTMGCRTLQVTNGPLTYYCSIQT